MNRRAHWMSVAAGFFILVIGLAQSLPLPIPRFLPPSWQVIYLLLPNGLDWVYPALWALAGLVSLAGVRWTGALRLGFRMSALLFMSWGVAGIQAIVLNLGGNIEGSSANMVTAILAWQASYGVGVGEGLVRLDEKVDQARQHEPD